MRQSNQVPLLPGCVLHVPLILAVLTMSKAPPEQDQ